jgi:hypothetical protein
LAKGHAKEDLRAWITRIEFERFPELGNRAVEILFDCEAKAEVVVCGGVFRIKPKRFVVFTHGLFQPVLIEKDIAVIVVKRRPIRLVAKQVSILLRGCVEFPVFLQKMSQALEILESASTNLAWSLKVTEEALSDRRSSAMADLGSSFSR